MNSFFLILKTHKNCFSDFYFLKNEKLEPKELIALLKKHTYITIHTII